MRTYKRDAGLVIGSPQQALRERDAECRRAGRREDTGIDLTALSSVGSADVYRIGAGERIKLCEVRHVL